MPLLWRNRMACSNALELNHIILFHLPRMAAKHQVPIRFYCVDTNKSQKITDNKFSVFAQCRQFIESFAFVFHYPFSLPTAILFNSKLFFMHFILVVALTTIVVISFSTMSHVFYPTSGRGCGCGTLQLYYQENTTCAFLWLFTFVLFFLLFFVTTWQFLGSDFWICFFFLFRFSTALPAVEPKATYQARRLIRLRWFLDLSLKFSDMPIFCFLAKTNALSTN